jgi:hypothetical protein
VRPHGEPDGRVKGHHQRRRSRPRERLSDDHEVRGPDTSLLAMRQSPATEELV